MPPKNKINNKNKKSNNNNKQQPPAEPTSKQGKHNDPGLYAYRNTFISEITNELQSLSHKLKKSINEKKSEQQQEQEDEEKNIDEHQQKLEERFKQVEQLLHVPDPEPFLVCCVVNSIHNLRVLVDPKKKSKNDNDGSSSSSSDDESTSENEFAYDNNTRLWDYSLWDCPPKVLRSGKLQLYKFQQRQLEKQARFEKYRKDGENLAITTAIAKARKRQERLLFSEQHHHLSSKEKKSKKSKKEKKSKKSKNDKKNDDNDEVEKENDQIHHQQPFSGDFVTVSSWTSIPAPPIISATTRHEKVIIDENEDEEDDEKKKQEKQYPPPKKIPISPMPSCYLSTYDKNVNPIVSKVAKETNNDKEEMDLVFHATIQAASAGAAATVAENNNTNKVNKKKNGGNDHHNNHHRPNFHSAFVDAPPSRVIYDPSRYSKVVAQTDFEIPHPALPQLAATFNTKMEISCLLTAPTMYHDMPSSAESMAMSEYEQKYYAKIPSTQEWMEKVIPTADLPVFPTAAALRIFGKGAQKGLREFLERYRSEYSKMMNRDDGSEESKKKNGDDDDDDDDETSTIGNSNSKNSEQQPTHCHAPYSTSLTTTKRRIKFPYYAALLKLYFKGTDAENENDDDDEDQDENNQEYIASSSEAKSSSNGIFVSTSNKNSKNDNNDNDDNNVLYHDIHLPQKLLSNETSFTLVHTLGPVQFLPPVESALLVPRAPTSMSLVICEVPDPELSCAEKILVRYILDILESDEFYGSVPHTQLYNLIRDTPQFDVVIGAGGADGQCCYETFIDFVDAHVNVEFAGFSYTQEEIDELLLKRLNEEMMQEQNNNSKQDITSTSSTSNNKPTEKKSDLEKQFASFGIPQELRLVAWKNVNHFIEGDYARWASKLENERKVCDVLASFLSVRPYEQLELLKLVGQDRAFVSLAVPCVKRMLDQVAENPRYVVLNSRLHPLTVELREDLVDIMKRNYYFSSSSSTTSKNTRGRNRSGFHNEDLSSGADEDETEEERQERRRRDKEISERDPQGVLTVRQQRLFDRIFTQEW